MMSNAIISIISIVCGIVFIITSKIKFSKDAEYISNSFKERLALIKFIGGICFVIFGVILLMA